MIIVYEGQESVYIFQISTNFAIYRVVYFGWKARKMPLCVTITDLYKKKVNKKKAVVLLYITQVCENNATQYDFLKCPLCKRGRLCDIPHGGMVTVRSERDTGVDGIVACIVVKCPKCSSRFTIYIK